MLPNHSLKLMESTTRDYEEHQNTKHHSTRKQATTIKLHVAAVPKGSLWD